MSESKFNTRAVVLTLFVDSAYSLLLFIGIFGLTYLAEIILHLIDGTMAYYAGLCVKSIILVYDVRIIIKFLKRQYHEASKELEF